MPTVSCSVRQTSDTRALDAGVMPLNSPSRSLGPEESNDEGERREREKEREGNTSVTAFATKEDNI